MKRRVESLMAAAITMFALTLAPQLAHAGPATDAIKSRQTVMRDLLVKDSAVDRKKLSAMLDDLFDFQAISEGALGSEWAARSDAEKAQFGSLLKQLVRRAHERSLRQYLRYGIEYPGEEAAGGAVAVKTKFQSKDNPREEPVEVVFTIAAQGGAFKVKDIMTEGVSMVGSYRSQFTKIVKKDGFAALIAKMKDKLAKDDA